MSEATPSPRVKLAVTSSPHVFDRDTVSRIMWEVNLALVPALLMSLYVFGLHAVGVILATILGAVVAEVLIQALLLNKPISVTDGSAVLTGLLLAFCVPVALPPWIAFIGGFLAIAFGKQVFGGLGQNIFNPAHVARAILLSSWPLYMTTWIKPLATVDWSGSLDGFTQATPLGMMKMTLASTGLAAEMKAAGTTAVQHVFQELGISWSNLFIGTIGGSLGETSKLALLVGGLFLLIRGHITWPVPVSMIGTVGIGSFLITGDPTMALFHVLTGGLIIGALFMATDMVTSPITTKGQLLFGLGCGAITLLIRMKGGYPEGVCYSILIMNAFVPLIDRFTQPKKFGVIDPVPVEAKA
jgi:electron transport complex protein RnfD